LDIPTRETIENMLQEYPWAIVFVSHDQYFANKIHINTTYTIQDRKIITTHHLSL
jgi:ATPase subunit of ABC transporter with duplicated ATPase domains